jgi:hypothetical protein
MRIGLSAAFVFLMSVFPALAQEPGRPNPPAGREQRRFDPNEFVAGRITEVTSSGFVLERRDGSTVKVQLTDKTEFRKDGEAAKREDFPVGTIVFVRGTAGEGGVWVAQAVATRTGPGSPGGGMGLLGGEFIAGEVKVLDPPSLTILKPDGASVTLELDENTSLRRGRESITMADIHAGDHVVVRGETKDGKYLPKGLNVVTPEQWERMMQMRARRGGPPSHPPGTADKKEEPQKPDPPER